MGRFKRNHTLVGHTVIHGDVPIDYNLSKLECDDFKLFVLLRLQWLLCVRGCICSRFIIRDNRLLFKPILVLQIKQKVCY